MSTGPSNETGWLDDQRAFERDIAWFCEAHGGKPGSVFSADQAKIIAAMSDQPTRTDLHGGQDALAFLRARAGNKPTFWCSTTTGYSYVGELIYRNDGANVISLRIRLNLTADGTPLTFVGEPEVR